MSVGGRLVAQDGRPDLAAVSATLERFEAGDSTVRPGLESAGRALLVWATQHRMVGADAHLVARVGFALGSPLADADNPITQRESYWRRGAVRALRSALAADSGDTWAALALERLEPYPHVWLEPEKELLQLRALAARDASLPLPLQLALLGMEVERGDPDRAVAVLQRLHAGSISESRWHHLAAEVGFAQGDARSAAQYYEGAADIATAEDAALYRRDLALIAEPEELAEWDSLALGLQAAWLHRFWDRRDLVDLRNPGTRLKEHLARYRIALRDYRWDQVASHAAGTSSQPGMGIDYNDGDEQFLVSEYMTRAAANRIFPVSRVLDDRGRLIVRHGLPTAESPLPGITSMGQALLAWNLPSGRLVVGFSSPAVMPPSNRQPDLRWGMLARNIPMGDLVTGCHLDAKLCGMAASKSQIRANETIRRYSEMRATAESTDGNPVAVKKDLGAIIQVYGVPGGGVLVVFAIPATHLRRSSGRARAALRVVVGDSVRGQIVAALDTVRAWRVPAKLAGATFVSAWQLVDAPTGTWRVGTFIADSVGEQGSALVFPAVPVIPAEPRGIALGDAILGRKASGLHWSRLGHDVALNPTGAWYRDEPGALSIEARGLVPGSEYGLTIELRSGDEPDAPARVAVGESLRPDAAVILVQREISFARLRGGSYRLVVRLTDPRSGESAVRERMLVIDER